MYFSISLIEVLFNISFNFILYIVIVYYEFPYVKNHKKTTIYAFRNIQSLKVKIEKSSFGERKR